MVAAPLDQQVIEGGKPEAFSLDQQRDLGQQAHGEAVKCGIVVLRQVRRELDAAHRQNAGRSRDNHLVGLQGSAIGFQPDAGTFPVNRAHRRRQFHRHVGTPAMNQCAKPFPGKIIGVEVGGPGKVGNRYFVDVLGKVHRPGKGACGMVAPGRLQQFRDPVRFRGIGDQQFRERLFRCLHLGDLVCGRPGSPVVEPVDTHVVMIQRPARRLRFGKEGIAISRMQPGTALVERQAEGVAFRPCPAADAVHGLQHLDLLACRHEHLRRTEAGGASTDNRHIHAGHEVAPIRRSVMRCSAPTSATRQAARIAAMNSADQIWIVWP